MWSKQLSQRRFLINDEFTQQSSATTTTSTTPIQRYLPTYRLDPKQSYDREKCEEIISTTLTESLESFAYEPNRAENLSKTISEEILAKVKNLNYDRFKFVCIVTICEKNMQGICNMFRCLWDCQRDGYAFHVYDSKNVFAIGTIYALYFD